MKNDRTPTRRASAIARILTGGLLLVACADTTGLPGPGQPQFSNGVDVMFNPQPEPPKEIFRFLIDTPELIDNPDLIDNPELRPWTGVLLGGRDGEAGVVTVEHLLPAVQHGRTFRLSQRWSFVIGEDASRVAEVQGTLNLQNGLLVLTGVNGDGRTVQIHARLGSGGGSIGGEVMFNPQPEPPMPQR